MRDREAAFDAWLHDSAGYHYVGPTSIYRLTVPEMARLRRGFEVLREQADEQADERVAQNGTGEAQRHAANPHRAAPGRVRSGDKAALNEFAAKNNLRKN